jgi:prepilin-type processing-associated H-X9-DG protein
VWLSNQKQLGTAFTLYIQDYDETFPPTDYDMPVFGRFAWPTLVEPYVKAGIEKPRGSLESKDQKKSVFVCSSISEAVDDRAWVAENGDSGSRPLLSYGTNVYLLPRGRGLVAPQVPLVVPLAAVGSPASLVVLGPNLGTIPDISGQDDSYNGASKHAQGYMLARSRHSRGANYTFADGHAKWYKVPDNYKAPSLSGPCWQSPRQGARYANCSAWFYGVGD